MTRAYYASMSSILITMERPVEPRASSATSNSRRFFREKLFGWQSTAVRAFVEEFEDFVVIVDGCVGNIVIARGEDGLCIAEIIETIYRGDEGKASTSQHKE